MSDCSECGSPVLPPKKIYCSKRCRTRALNRKHRAAPEVGRAYAKKWRKANPDKAREANVRNYARHRDERIASIREYEHRNPEKRRAWAQAARRTSGYNALLTFARKRAEKAEVPYTLTIEWAKEHWTGICELSGIPFSFEYSGTGGPRPRSPSLDRVDPKLGYTPENSRFILHGLNAMKGSGTDEDMKEIILVMARMWTMDLQSLSQ